MTIVSDDMRRAKSLLFFGGARSGKSERAEDVLVARAREHGSGQKIYIATADVLDDEMASRVAAHQSRRDASWRTLDVPLELPEALKRRVKKDDFVLVDCLTLWLSNVMARGDDVNAVVGELLAAVEQSDACVMFVSNELGFGIVPENKLARAFRDQHGLLNQKIASVVDYVELVAAGLPLKLKP